MKPTSTSNARIESNRLNQEIKKLDRDKMSSIHKLAASQAQMHKSLQKIMSGAIKISQKASATDADGQPNQPARPSGLNIHAGTSRTRKSDPNSSRVNIRTADPDALATASTKSFHGKIIGGQAQIQRALSSSRASLLSRASQAATASPSRTPRTDTTASRALLQPDDNVIYDVQETSGGGSATGISFTHEEVSKGVQDSPGPQASQEPTEQAAHDKGPASEIVPKITKQAPTEDSSAQNDGTPKVGDTSNVPANNVKNEVPTVNKVLDSEQQAGVKDQELQDDPDVVAQKGKKAKQDENSSQNMTKTQPRWSTVPRGSIVPSLANRISEVKGHLSQLSQTSGIEAKEKKKSTPILRSVPDTIDEGVYCKAVERAFASKCLKYSKLVTDLEMREFVLDYLMVEKQNDNFSKANRFVELLTESEGHDGYPRNEDWEVICVFKQPIPQTKSNIHKYITNEHQTFL